MEKEKVKKIASINSTLVIQAIELREIADELNKLCVKSNCENAVSVREHLDSIEIKLTDAYLTVSGVNQDIYNLIKK